MKRTLSLLFLPAVFLLLAAGPILAQSPPPPPEEGQEQEDESSSAPSRPVRYDDFTVKGYSLMGLGGYFSGGQYLENQPLGPRTVITDGGAPIYAFNPNGPNSDEDGVHIFSQHPDYEAAHKSIESGPSFGAQIGIYIAEHFHLDLMGSYSKGKAVTSMLYTDPDEPELDPVRLTVDEDDGFKVIKGGLALGYDAEPATFFGLTPTLGFGLGGIINRYSYLEDKTGLYLEGNFALTTSLTKNIDLAVALSHSIFSFEVDELGYSNIVKYTSYTFGLRYFVDVIPAEVRAAHEAERDS